MLRRVVCGMSGGVDSAVTAGLLKRQGFDVVGVHMENWDEQDENGVCRKQREEDLKDAREACRRLGVPFTTVSFVKDYWNDVFSTLIQDYSRGFTPNPDVLCNRFLKFGSFVKYAREHCGAEFVATGHYAQVRRDQDGRARLLRALDSTKDQTLFLSGVHQSPLQQTLFPLGQIYKSQVRKLARDFGLENIASKRDSVGICFIGVRSFSQFIREYIPNRVGPFVELESGEIIGEHLGVHHFTIGQRCRIPGARQRLYVAARDPETQVIYAVKERDHPALYCDTFEAEEPHWICDVPDFTDDKPFLCMFKFQHTEWTTPALLHKPKTPTSPTSKIKVQLGMHTRALTPGQVAVFYHGNVCLGSAKIVWVDVLTQLGLKPLTTDHACTSPPDSLAAISL